MRISAVRLLVHRRASPLGETAPPPFGGGQRIGALSIDTDEGVSGQTLIALWDLSARAANRPLHALLGAYRDELPAYLSSWVHARPEDYAEEAAHYQQQGWPAYKLHPLTQRRGFYGEDVPLRADIEACRLVREAVGDDMVLMLDSAWAYDYPSAVTVGRAIEELGYHWYEDPLRADDVPGYVRLKQQLHIPVVATEITEGGLTGMREWAVSGATVHHFSYGLTEPLDIEAGVARAPTRPGLGYDIDWELIGSDVEGEL